MAATVFKYYVAELEQIPHPSVPKIVYIPASWVRGLWDDKRVVVSYPEEQYVAVEGRILTGEPYDPKWPVHMGTVIFGCDDIHAARRYAATQNHDQQASSTSNDDLKFGRAPAKRTLKRSKSVDAKTFNESKRRRVSILDEAKSFQPGDPKEKKSTEATTQTDQSVQNKKKEIELLKKLSNTFNTIKDSFETMAETLKVTTNIVENVSTNLCKCEKVINAFLNGNDVPPTEKHSAGNETNRRRKLSEGPRRFEFPDNSDTSYKWTLRHRDMKEGMIELLKKSGVYVRKDELEKLDTAKDPTTVARLLMTEIFSDYALSVCTLKCKGKNSNVPGLDQYSRIVMMMYLKEYFCSRNWIVDDFAIDTSLRNKLRENRRSSQHFNEHIVT